MARVPPQKLSLTVVFTFIDDSLTRIPSRQSYGAWCGLKCSEDGRNYTIDTEFDTNNPWIVKVLAMNGCGLRIDFSLVCQFLRPRHMTVPFINGYDHPPSTFNSIEERIVVNGNIETWDTKRPVVEMTCGITKCKRCIPVISSIHASIPAETVVQWHQFISDTIVQQLCGWPSISREILERGCKNAKDTDDTAEGDDDQE